MSRNRFLLLAIIAMAMVTAAAIPTLADEKPMYRLETSIKAIGSQLKNASAKLKNDVVGFTGDRSPQTKTLPGGEMSLLVKECCARNVQGITSNIQGMKLALKEMEIRFRKEENAEALQAVGVVSSTVKSLDEAVASFSRAGSKRGAERSLKGARQSLVNVNKARDDLVEYCGNSSPEEKRQE
jgi:hypothetical protein